MGHLRSKEAEVCLPLPESMDFQRSHSPLSEKPFQIPRSLGFPTQIEYLPNLKLLESASSNFGRSLEFLPHCLAQSAIQNTGSSFLC